MAWVTPITFVSNTQLTAAQLNQNVRDNQNFLLNGKIINKVSYTGAANYTTVATSFGDVDATNLIATSVITSGNVCVTVTFTTSMSLAAVRGQFDVIVDSTTRSGGTNGSFEVINQTVQSSTMTMVCYFTGLSAASHTFKPQWKVASGTGTIYSSTNDTIIMVVEEI